MNEEKPQVNFYKLDKTKPYSFIGVHGSTNFFIALAIFFAVSTAMMLGFGFKWFFKDTQSTVIPVLMIAAAVLFSVAAIWFHLRQRAKRRAQNSVLENCTLTDGVIIGVNRRSVKVNDRWQDEIDLVYRFTDDKANGRTASVTTQRDDFFEGQNIVVAFTETESFIMTEYSLMEEDAQKLIEAESARSEDDFEDLDNELLDIDISKPVKSAEGNFTYKLLAIIFAVMLILYSVPIGVFLLPQFFDGGAVIPNAIGCAMALLLPVILIICITILLYKYVKREKRVKQIIKDKPYFTWGKIFYSEKTYNGSSKKQLLYCYIDKWNEKRTEKFHGVFSNAMARPRSAVIIAYTADGRSVPIEKFTYLYPEDYELGEEGDENGTDED